MIIEPFSVNRRLAVKAVEPCLRALIRIVGERLGGRLASLKIAVGAVLLSLLTSVPPYLSMSKDLNHPTIQALCVKIRHPLSPIPPDLKDFRLHGEFARHIDKLELRLTIPILGWLSGTGRWTVIVWNHVSAFGVFYLLACVASKALDDNVGGGLFALGVGPTFFGSWFFNDLYFGDGTAFFFLLLSIASKNLVVSSCSFLVAAFCDERCVAAVPLVLLYFLISLRHDTEAFNRLKHCIAIIVGLGMWLVLRSWVAGACHLTMGTSMLATREILRTNLERNVPGAFLGVFKASWTLSLLGVLSLVGLRKWAMLAAFVGAFAVAVAPAFLVVDFDRSVCYTFIVLLVSLHFLWGDRDASRRYLAGILLANCLLISPGRTILRIGHWLF